MKKKQAQSLSLFETNEPQKQEELSKSSPKTNSISDPLACPRCGNASQPAAHPQDHGGATRYCIFCFESDGEPYYFTPLPPGQQIVKEAFDNVLQETLREIDAKLGTSVALDDEPIEVSASKYDQEKLFVAPVEPASGKTIEALEYSRERATEVMRMFDGQLPQSIMKAEKKSRGAADLATGTYVDSGKYKDGVWGASGRGCSNGALSAFPQNIGKACLLLYTEKGDTVFDPFAGHNSRMEFCVRAGRNYIGCDISAKFMEFNRKQADKLRLEYPEVFIELHEIDSRKIDTIEMQELADFTVTSPPYYDIEDYGDEYQQLGKSENYFEFMRSIKKIAKHNFAKLKKGAFCVWFINDFRREGKFHCYHVDTLHALEEAGFTAWDIMITDFGGSFGQCFPAQVVERKILPKRHEYGIIMRKL